MKKLYFVTGSQDLYGEDTLKQVARDSSVMVEELNELLQGKIQLVWTPTVRNSEEIKSVMGKVNSDEDCVGVITWMHTFSPAKMWIKGLQDLKKPLLHLHTQMNARLPYQDIDMDFMNLNQSAHGDREYSFILTRLAIPHEIAVGYYKNERVVNKIADFARVATAIGFSKNLKVAMFGSNMREVAVTDGDRVESQIKYGWEVNYYGIGDLVEIANDVTDEEVSAKMAEYANIYEIDTTDIKAVEEQAKYEIAMDKFIVKGGFGAFTDNFQDLHGLRQLPGLATQRMMAKGIGFGGEGDYKTSAMDAIMNKMGEGKNGGTGFMEDYTYDLILGEEIVLGAHMLEVSPNFASTKPKIQVHPLGIGDKEPPARLVFDGIKGDGVAVCMIDMGTHFRLIVAKIQLVSQPESMPKLPVARIMWKLQPNFEEGAKGWLKAGGGHHTVVSTQVSVEDLKMFANLTKTEIIVIE